MSKTVDDLIGVYIEASNAVVWEAEKRGLCPMTLDMQRAGIAAVVRAIRDEMQTHCYTHGEPECCGRGVPNYNNTGEECCGAPTMKVTDEIVIGMFNEILGDAGEKVAGEKASYPSGVERPSAPATDPAPDVCVWRKGRDVTDNTVWGLPSCRPWTFAGVDYDVCPSCCKPISFKEPTK